MTSYILPNSNKRAQIIKTNGRIYLQSYNTIILSTDLNGSDIQRHWNGWTSTTGRHIKDLTGLNKAKFLELDYIPIDSWNIKQDYKGRPYNSIY